MIQTACFSLKLLQIPYNTLFSFSILIVIPIVWGVLIQVSQHSGIGHRNRRRRTRLWTRIAMPMMQCLTPLSKFSL